MTICYEAITFSFNSINTRYHKVSYVCKRYYLYDKQLYNNKNITGGDVCYINALSPSPRPIFPIIRHRSPFRTRQLGVGLVINATNLIQHLLHQEFVLYLFWNWAVLFLRFPLNVRFYRSQSEQDLVIATAWHCVDKSPPLPYQLFALIPIYNELYQLFL